jgi:hypothetical protein
MNKLKVLALLKLTFLKVKHLFQNPEISAEIVFINLTTQNESERFLRRVSDNAKMDPNQSIRSKQNDININ